VNNVSADLDLLIAVIIAIAAVIGGLLLRGPLRFVVLIAGLLAAGYVAGLLAPPVLG
jgi:uncharacterized membrane protein required for colicin V production